MEKPVNDGALLEMIATLSSRRESGRLQIKCGATRGAFFFKNGKLVDARMGPFTGFPAVNLAVSILDARLSFDPSIQLPSCSFNALTEPYVRRMLRERFAIETDEAEASERDSEAEGDEPALISSSPPAQGKFHLLSASDSQKDETGAIRDGDDSALKVLSSIVANPLLARPVTTPAEMKSRNLRRILASFSQSVRVLVKPSLVYSTREKVAAGSILFIIIVTAVSIASSFSKGKKTLRLDVSLPPAAGAPSTSIVAPAASHGEDKSLGIRPSVKALRPTLQPSTFEAVAPLKNKDTESLPANAPDGDKKATSPAALEVRASDEKPAANPPSRAIAVVIQIDEGHVTEAYIQNRQVGLGAFEATALRLARQRRFPKDTKRQETMILHVTSGTIKEVP